MPTYEYECTKCGEKFDRFQSIKAKAMRTIATDCKQCNNKAPVRRLIGTGAAVLFKGSGFYQTDYRSEAYKKAASADKEGATESKSSDKKDGGKTSKKEKADTGGGDGPKKSSSSTDQGGD